MENHLLPLFWQHHEGEDALRGELREMRKSGIGAFIVEARPHPHYLEQEWWEDLEIILDEAKGLGMRLYIFDDGAYPSGYANGLLEKRHPDLTKRYLAQRHIDAAGPLPDSSFLVGDFVGKGERLVAVVAARRTDKLDHLDAGSLTAVTSFVEDGILYWDVPEGDWRIFVLIETREGGEAHTKNYLNPLTKEATKAFLDIVYEPHYQRLGKHFGETIAGFFSDEPRFGNAPSYENCLGKPETVIPWSDSLLDTLSGHSLALGDFTKYLPLLWYPSSLSPDARYVYMDVVSLLFSQNFIGQIGEWCRGRGVSLIGHFVEENGAHARLGYGAGHYFRASRGFDMAGIDIVCNLYPGQRDGRFKTAFNYFDADFNHWGLAKLASSEARLDPRKNGNSFSESFGAYGWSEGLKTMKWITDVICVRGINNITPHAFSPKEYPDPDCPPHFYAGGRNPQWPYFDLWAGYANRICDLLSGGEHIAPVAVLYHAEAEWGGAYQPFEKVVKQLLRKQIDCIALSCDHLLSISGEPEDGALYINGHAIKALAVPYAQYLPAPLSKALSRFAGKGFPILFSDGFPDRCYGGGDFEAGGMLSVPLEGLAEELRRRGIGGISAVPESDALAYRHYRKDGKDLYFLTNEDSRETVQTTLSLPGMGPVYLYDALTDTRYQAQAVQAGEFVRLPLILEPYQSIFVLFGEAGELEERPHPQDYPNAQNLDGGWTVRMAPYDAPGHFGDPLPLSGLCNLSAPRLYPRFSGVMRYETTVNAESAEEALLDLGRVGEIARVRLNGKELGRLICPPYRIFIPAGILKKGANCLEIEVVNTLVKANHSNIFDRYWPQEPSGLLGPVTLRTKALSFLGTAKS